MSLWGEPLQLPVVETNSIIKPGYENRLASDVFAEAGHQYVDQPGLTFGVWLSREIAKATKEGWESIAEPAYYQHALTEQGFTMLKNRSINAAVALSPPGSIYDPILPQPYIAPLPSQPITPITSTGTTLT